MKINGIKVTKRNEQKEKQLHVLIKVIKFTFNRNLQRKEKTTLISYNSLMNTGFLSASDF